MGLISPGGENLLDFLELRQLLSSYDWVLRDPLWWPQESPVPMRVARGPLLIPLPSMLGPKILCGEGLLLRCKGNAGNSLATTQGMDPSSGAGRQKRGFSGCGRNSRASSRVETGMSGNFLSCSKGVKDPLEVPEVKCD